MELRLRVDVHHHFPPESASGHILPLLHELRTLIRAVFAQGERIMAQADDIRAGQVVQKGIVDELAQDVSTVASEVADLIARLAGGGQGQDLTDIVSNLQDSNARLQAAADALRAIPTAPSSAPPNF